MKKTRRNSDFRLKSCLQISFICHNTLFCSTDYQSKFKTRSTKTRDRWKFDYCYFKIEGI